MTTQHTTGKITMIPGTIIELINTWVNKSEGKTINSNTRGRVARRINGGWLLVKFDGQDKCVKVRSSICRLANQSKVNKPLSSKNNKGNGIFNKKVEDELMLRWNQMTDEKRDSWVSVIQQIESWFN